MELKSPSQYVHIRTCKTADDLRQARTVTVGLSQRCGLPDPAAQWRQGKSAEERR